MLKSFVRLFLMSLMEITIFVKKNLTDTNIITNYEKGFLWKLLVFTLVFDAQEQVSSLYRSQNKHTRMHSYLKQAPPCLQVWNISGNLNTDHSGSMVDFTWRICLLFSKAISYYNTCKHRRSVRQTFKSRSQVVVSGKWMQKATRCTWKFLVLNKPGHKMDFLPQ